MELKENSITDHPQSFRTLNDFWATKKPFCDNITQSETLLHQKTYKKKKSGDTIFL